MASIDESPVREPLTFPHEVKRFAIDVRQPYDEFKQRFEDAVPVVDTAADLALVGRGAAWPDVLAQVAQLASHDFLIYWKSDVTALMRLAGDAWTCTSYLMGNHAVAQKMYHYDPAVMLYAPLRIALYVDKRHRTRFAFDQPSTVFSSFEVSQIASVGLELDAKMATLLAILGIDVPDALTS